MTPEQDDAMRRMRSWFDDHLTFAEVHVGDGAFCIRDLSPMELTETREAVAATGGDWRLDYWGPFHYHLTLVTHDPESTTGDGLCE